MNKNIVRLAIVIVLLILLFVLFYDWGEPDLPFGFK